VLFSLVYTSRAVSPMTRDDLTGLLRQCRAHNTAARLSGILLYRNQTFVQLLEGQRNRVEPLYEAIRRDPRHHEVTTVSTREQLDRQFPDWSMAFDNLDEEPVSLPGYSDLLDEPGTAASAEAGLVRELLGLFDRQG
jgi:hypothetical protein